MRRDREALFGGVFIIAVLVGIATTLAGDLFVIAVPALVIAAVTFWLAHDKRNLIAAVFAFVAFRALIAAVVTSNWI